MNSTIATVTALQGNVSPYTDAFLCAGNQELFATIEEIMYRSFAPDGLASMSGIGKWTQSIPDEEVNYKLRIRAKNLKNLTVPVGRIVAIQKTGTTTATVTTDVAHGLNALDFVNIYGVNDQVNFPNLAPTLVASIVDATHFTIVIGTASSTSSVGGVVWRVNGGVTAPGIFNQAISSISRTGNILSVVSGVAWATPLPGEYMQIWGMQNGASQYDGAYKVLRVNTTTLELESIGTDFGSITNVGGACFRRTDVRIHFVRILDYTRLVAEISGGKANITDLNNAVPVALVGGAVSTVASVTTVATVSDLTRFNNIGNTTTRQHDAILTFLYDLDRTNWANNVRQLIQ